MNGLYIMLKFFKCKQLIDFEEEGANFIFICCVQWFDLIKIYTPLSMVVIPLGTVWKKAVSSISCSRGK